MLKDLKFVQGAVAKKDFIPALNHFRIENGEIRSFNGTLALSTPIDFDLDCTPRAEPFVKAIQNCKETVSLNMTPGMRLGIKSGAFKAYIECVEDETPHVIPEGEHYNIDGEKLLKAFKVISPFIGNDASRPWSNGVLLKDGSAFATNNISLIEYWIGPEAFPMICNVPKEAIREMVRIGEPPIGMQMTDKSITFHYENKRWIRSQLLNTDWPDLNALLNANNNAVPLDETIFDALEVIKPFTDKLGRVYIRNGAISTSLIKDEGASYDIPDFPYEGVFQLSILNNLKGVAKYIDFTLYPNPCIFYGENLRGALVGMRS